MDDAPPLPPSPPGSPDTMDRKLNPGVLLLIAILAMAFFIFGLLNLLAQNLLRLRRARRRRRRVGDDAAAAPDGSSPTAFQGQLQQLFHLHDAGVDQAFIDALPVFPYRAVVRHRRRDAAKAEDDDEEPPSFDCAVCLCEFAGDDKLRLLPTCGHAFHVPCIDAWLLSHSTCPLCRASILDVGCSYSTTPSPSPSSLLLLHHSYGGLAETETSATVTGGGGDPGDDRDGGESPPPPPPKDAAAEEEVVEVKLGKLRCVDGGNASACMELAGDGAGTSLALGQRRCLSMGSYEYVMADHAALRVTIKSTTTPKRRSSSSSSRRRHALSACDLAACPKKAAGAWEAAVTEAAADGRCCGDGAASLGKDSFSTSKIWMASSAAAKREGDGRRRPGPAAEPAAGESRRAASFRWPAMGSGCKRHRRDEEPGDVEAGGAGAGDDNAASSSSLAEERPPAVPWPAVLWVAGGRQGSHS